MIQPKPLSERLGAGWGKPAVRTAEVYDFRSRGGEWDEAMLPFKASRRMHKCTTRKPAGEVSPHIRWCQERTTNGCGQVRGRPLPSLPTSLPAAGRACGRWEKSRKQRPCPRSERSGHSLTPHWGPLSHRKDHSRGKGVIRRTGPCMSWIRLNETLQNRGGHTELRFAQEVIDGAGRGAWGIVSGKTSPVVVPEGWVAPFLISLVFCLHLTTAMMMKKNHSVYR